MKKLIFATTFLMMTFMSFGGDYTTGIGLRGGLSSGITAKYFLDDRVAVEGILSTRWRGFIITGLYEINAIAFDTPGLYWYYGGGAHIGFWDGYSGHPWFENNGSETVLGIDGIIGLEYNFADFPINISLDWKPALNLTGYSGFWGDSGAISVRYIF